MKYPHPLILILSALWFSSLAIFISDTNWMSVILMLSLLFRGFLARFQIRLWFQEVLRFLPLIAIIIILQVLFHDPNTLRGAHHSGIYINPTGLQMGLTVSMRLLIVFFSAQVLLRLSYEDFDLAFRSLRLPEELCFMVFYTIHVIPSAANRVKHSLRILRLRGINLGKLKLKAKLMLYQRISLNVIAGLLSGSDIQATALELRGFRSSGPRSRLHTRRFSFSDAILLLALALVTCLIVITV